MPEDLRMARFKALMCGLAAQCGQLMEQDVEELEEVAGRLAPGCATRHMCLAFCTQYYEVYRRADDLAAAGQALLDQLEGDVMPVPPGQDRRDING